MPRGDQTHHTNATSLGVDRAGSPLVGGCQPTNSRRVSSSRALEPRELTPSTGGSRGEANHTLGRHSPVTSKLSDELREYLANQPRLVLIGVNGTARPFFFVPFHSEAR